jgi:hypothetical protein
VTIEFARYVAVAGATLLGWLVFVWARALYGGAGGLLALTLPCGAEAGLRVGNA